MGEIRVAFALYGAFDVRIDGSPVNLGLTGPTRSLLQFLVCSGGRLIRREQLMELFWGETSPQRRRSSLNSAVWRIKKALRAVDAPGDLCIDASADCVRLLGTDAPGVEIDIIGLARSLHEASTPDAEEGQIEDLLTVLLHCEGLPLDGVDDDWAAVERQRLITLRIQALSVAMRHLKERRRYCEAIEFGQRILLDDPFHESALQELLCIHALGGQRARALRLFDEFSSTLRAELGIQPTMETCAMRDYLAGDAQKANMFANGQAQHPCAIRETPQVADLMSTMQHARCASG